jgi:alkylation response protein AidB-like acyl-CoA dehydrogenase
LQLLRLLTPVAKLYTAKQAVAIASEVVEAFGGAGYVEDTGIPRLLRDAQVLPIWEGTTNVLSLDTLRAIQKADALTAWAEDLRQRLARIGAGAITSVSGAVDSIMTHLGRDSDVAAESHQAAARSIAYSIARTEAAVLLLEHAQATRNPAADAAARRWCARDLARVANADDSHRADSRNLVD